MSAARASKSSRAGSFNARLGRRCGQCCVGSVFQPVEFAAFIARAMGPLQKGAGHDAGTGDQEIAR